MTVRDEYECLEHAQLILLKALLSIPANGTEQVYIVT